jgi:hypothetical protein
MTETIIGKPCKKCGTSEKYAKNPIMCIKCAKERHSIMKKKPAPKQKVTPAVFPPSKPGFDPFGRPWGLKE